MEHFAPVDCIPRHVEPGEKIVEAAAVEGVVVDIVTLWAERVFLEGRSEVAEGYLALGALLRFRTLWDRPGVDQVAILSVVDSFVCGEVKEGTVDKVELPQKNTGQEECAVVID
eukprot:CAMPEP_0175892388 /NCGR_PEP_ID=MMETSP0107_2-20121207/48891_1 /TAXON_ID=195067 ORGANISM="Goniomonas pacifica, Strain CCMP1869" /NCGR_SAMPLE_ID=MMETSP0107_2 /ASSEMBLY_ACC=CAM_ASM_000203 /LENGTH=113 /DNA_ID=CAMNT_0017213329 /DNA_START=35 /DNA_END=376 /DNA_ORIENTATION=+